jgi:hypothetical protein
MRQQRACAVVLSFVQANVGAEISSYKALQSMKQALARKVAEIVAAAGSPWTIPLLSRIQAAENHPARSLHRHRPLAPLSNFRAPFVQDPRNGQHEQRQEAEQTGRPPDPKAFVHFTQRQ